MESTVNAVPLSNAAHSSFSRPSSNSGNQMIKAIRTRKRVETEVKQAKCRILSLQRALEACDRQQTYEELTQTRHSKARSTHKHFQEYLTTRKNELSQAHEGKKRSVKHARKSLQESMRNSKEQSLVQKQINRNRARADSEWNRQFIKEATEEANQWRKNQALAARHLKQEQATKRMKNCKSQCSIRTELYKEQIQQELRSANQGKQELEQLKQQELKLLEELQLKSRSN